MATASNLFDWDEANIAHVAEHGVLPSESEEVIADNPLDLDYSVRNGIAPASSGETSMGRHLAVITTARNGLLRVITAYPASRFLRITYLERKKLRGDGKENPS